MTEPQVPYGGTRSAVSEGTPKVGFYVYPVAFQNPGGGEVQLLKTKEALEKQGVHVELFDQWTDKVQDFDLIHTFGSVKEASSLMKWAKVAGVPNVLSTICWYSWRSSWYTYPQWKPRAASLIRHFTKSFLPFVPSERKSMMRVSDLLFPNSHSEAEQLKRFFGVPEEKILVVPNGVDPGFENAKPDAFIEKYGLKDFILCVGRIEPRKNQLNMIRALNGTGIPFVIIGDYVRTYEDYYQLCRKEADKNVHFLGQVPHQSGLLGSAYAACNTFLLASWLETPGLAALEAGLAGAKIVITGEGATREYFKDYASYVIPNDLADIRDKTKKVFERTEKPSLRQHIRDHYLWKHVALKTREGYDRVLSKRGRPV